ncbi:MAG: DNA polymerase/3'-5' exonuclease PolX [Patescibacteria group bacterium]|nr:DNA polymerase/3'-5' exonuclease PolX [Patescibacteria group bacterium]
MKNQEIAKIFHEIANFLAMEEVDFKPYAYRRAAQSLEILEEDVQNIYEKGGTKLLKKIPGIGKTIALQIQEYLKTGKIKLYQKLKKRTPVDLEEIINVEGMGPKRAKILYQKLNIKNLKDLEKKAKAHKIAPLFGFGEKTEKNILEGIQFAKKDKGRSLLGDILPVAREIFEKLKSLKEVEKIDIVGSVLRRKETIGDVDFLIASKNPKKVMDFFVSLPNIVKVWAKGSTKSSVRMKEGFDIDLRVVPKKSYGAASQYFIGSKEHNIATRRVAISKGLKLNEYGLFRGSKMIAGKDEKGIYEALGMQWIPPELREDQGEIEAALKRKLPKLIKIKDIRGDLHCHSSWDGGKNSIPELAKRTMEMGYEYLGISDHTKFLRIEHGLNEKQLSQERKEIDGLNSKFKKQNLKFRILQGAETNILNDGSIDIKDEALEKLDYAIAGVHSNLKMPKGKMTERVIRAMKNPNINIISHPTGRLLKKREEYEIDFNKILRAAKEFRVVLEINSSPQRLDLNGLNARRCKEAKVKMVINTDSHHKGQLKHIEFGVSQARRGWAEKEDIINTQPLKKLLEYFK